MNAGSVCKRGVVTVAPTDDLIAAAHVMREKHVGYLIVSEASALTLRHMREAGVRRVPVADRCGALSGVLSIDDVLERIAEQLINIAGSIRNEQRMERAVRQ